MVGEGEHPVASSSSLASANDPCRSHEKFSYRNNPAIPPFPDDHPIIIFDGMCVFCSGFARFVLRNDRATVFRLLAAQTSIGEALYRHYGLDPVNQETSVLLSGGVIHLKSDAGIRIFRQLGFPWSCAVAGLLIPRMARDWLYDIIATHRFRWFGRRDTCFLPDPSHRDRFIA